MELADVEEIREGVEDDCLTVQRDAGKSYRSKEQEERRKCQC